MCGSGIAKFCGRHICSKNVGMIYLPKYNNGGMWRKMGSALRAPPRLVTVKLSREALRRVHGYLLLSDGARKAVSG